VDRGLPEVPVDRIKAVWKAEKLNRSVQLTISGCLGPCDLPNVAVIITPGSVDWYGGLAGDSLYDALIDWGRKCHDAGVIEPAPASWSANRFERFPVVGGDAGPRRPWARSVIRHLSSYIARQLRAIAGHHPPISELISPGALPPGTTIRSPGRS
jgi:cobaltochelatase CobN